MSREHYELVAKWHSQKLPPFGAEFVYSGAEYRVVGANMAGDKLRCQVIGADQVIGVDQATGAEGSTAGKVFLFKIKELSTKYRGLRWKDSTWKDSTWKDSSCKGGSHADNP